MQPPCMQRIQCENIKKIDMIYHKYYLLSLGGEGVETANYF